MSRSFIKEQEEALEKLPELPLSAHANYVTPNGLARLRERQMRVRAQCETLRSTTDLMTEQGELQGLERELRWLDTRVGSAILIDPAHQPHDKVAFGARVTVDSTEGERHWRIVGEDEADAEHGLISYVSPLAQVLLGAEIGDEVIWERPAGKLAVTVLAIDYPL